MLRKKIRDTTGDRSRDLPISSVAPVFFAHEIINMHSRVVPQELKFFRFFFYFCVLSYTSSFLFFIFHYDILYISNIYVSYKYFFLVVNSFCFISLSSPFFYVLSQSEQPVISTTTDCVLFTDFVYSNCNFYFQIFKHPWIITKAQTKRQLFCIH